MSLMKNVINKKYNMRKKNETYEKYDANMQEILFFKLFTCRI